MIRDKIPMLKLMRKRTKIIIWSVIVVFCISGGVLFGIQLQDEGQMAGRVFGKSISFQEYQKFSRATEIFSFTKEPINDPSILNQQTWQNIIYAREAKRQRIEVSDAEVLQEIRRILASQNIQNPTPTFYENWVSQTVGGTARAFEEKVREIIRIQKLLLSVTNQEVESPSKEEAKNDFLLTKRKLRLRGVFADSQKDAEAFANTLEKGGDWRKQAEANEVLTPMETGMQTLKDLGRMLQISDNDIENLYQMSLNQASPTMLSGDKHLVVLLEEKAAVEEVEFEAEGVAEAYIEEMISFRKYQRFLDWNLELMNRADFKDFMTRASQNPPTT